MFSLGLCTMGTSSCALFKDGKITKGKLGKDLSVKEGQDAAKLCAINIIAQA